MTQQSLQQGGSCFLQGQLNQCKTLLDSLPLIDVQKSVAVQLVQEHNLLLCKEDVSALSPESRDGSMPLAAGVKQVLQKLMGLPASKKLFPLELAVAYNEAVLQHLQWNDHADHRVDAKRFLHELEKKLVTRLQRCRNALRLTETSRKEGMKCQLQEILQQANLDPDIASCLTLLSCIISAYYVINRDTDTAMSILDEVGHHVTQSSIYKQQLGSQFSLLMKLPSQNLSVKLCQDDADASAVFNISSMVELLKACCYYQDQQFSSCLKLLQTAGTPSVSNHLLPMWEYMKGYCLYQESCYFEAAHCIHDLLSSSTGCDSKIKARCHNLIGCCLAKQDHPNTAMQSFRSALQEDFNSIEPLYNLSLIYRQQKLWDAELESLNLLVTAIDNQDEGESSSKSSNIGLDVCLSAAKGGQRTSHDESNIPLTNALYILAKRCLELERYNIAAEKFLDLLAVVDESDVLLQTSVGSTVDCPIPTPSLQIIYLETALALYKAGQHDEAILVCDQILSKITKPAVTMATPNHGHDDESVDASSVKIVGGQSVKMHIVSDIPSTSADSRKLNLNTALASARKRPRDEDSVGQSSKVVTNPVTPLTKQNQTELRHMYLYCHALLLKSQCCRAVRNFDKVEEMLVVILDTLKGLTRVDTADGGQDESRTSELEPQSKKRRLDGANDNSQTMQPTGYKEPIRSCLLQLKTQASNDKALILIGQSKLQEAMKIFLRSLHYLPDNEDTQYNLILLLLKMDRTEDARDAFNKYRGWMDTKWNQLGKTFS